MGEPTAAAPREPAERRERPAEHKAQHPRPPQRSERSPAPVARRDQRPERTPAPIARLDEARRRGRDRDRKGSDEQDVMHLPAFLLRPVRVKA
jgi:hypothetical protein